MSRAKKTLKVKIKRSTKNQQWYFSIVSGNNEIIAQSEGYKRVDSCLKTVTRLKEGMAIAAVEFEIEE